jgi:glyoxylase-like metal-dependent hydrolase (beta-lactamase superfamily II)
VAEDGEFTLIDAGYPGYWKHLAGAIEALGTSPEAIRGVILTHHHADHVGTAERVRSRSGADVFIGDGDAWIAGGRYPSHANPGFYRQCSWRPSGIAFLAHSAAAGGARYRPLESVKALKGEQSLDLPGRPRVIHTPGHTAGHHSVSLEGRGVLLAGDAMANLDYATGKRGLGLHRFNDDRAMALASLDRLDDVAPDVVLFGHGEPWAGGLQCVVEIVRNTASAY